jgi:hypothetical protein
MKAEYKEGPEARENFEKFANETAQENGMVRRDGRNRAAVAI